VRSHILRFDPAATGESPALELKSSTAFVSRKQEQDLSHGALTRIPKITEAGRKAVSQFRAEPMDRKGKAFTEPAPISICWQWALPRGGYL